MGAIEGKAIEITKKYETRRTGREPQDVRRQRLGYDLESKDRKIEVKGTKANIPNKGGHHIDFHEHQYKQMRKYSNFWVYRVYDVKRRGKVIEIPRNVILTHLKPYTRYKLVLKKEEWKQLEK